MNSRVAGLGKHHDLRDTIAGLAGEERSRQLEREALHMLRTAAVAPVMAAAWSWREHR